MARCNTPGGALSTNAMAVDIAPGTGVELKGAVAGGGRDALAWSGPADGSAETAGAALTVPAIDGCNA